MKISFMRTKAISKRKYATEVDVLIRRNVLQSNKALVRIKESYIRSQLFQIIKFENRDKILIFLFYKFPH